MFCTKSLETHELNWAKFKVHFGSKGTRHLVTTLLIEKCVQHKETKIKTKNRKVMQYF